MSYPGKLINMISATASFGVSTVLHKPHLWALPPFISFELTNCCNLACSECITGSGLMTRQRGYIDILLFKRTIEELGTSLMGMNLYFQGEPMLHPGFSEFITYRKDIYTEVSTNGHFLSSENSDQIARSYLNRIIISVDGADQDTYSAYRVNGDLATVLEGIDKLAKAVKKSRSKLKIELQMLVNRHNEHQTESIRRIAVSAGARLRLKSMQVNDTDKIGEWVTRDDQFNRYKNVKGNYAVKSTLPDRCRRLWFNPVITWDGKVLPCCFDKNGEYIMGDLKKNTFREIWHGKQFYDFRNMVLNGRGSIGICRNCTSGLRGVRY